MQDSDLLARLIAAVYPHIDDDQELQQVKMQFEIILHDYTVARAETAIEPYKGDINEGILLRFLEAKLAKGCSQKTIRYYKQTVAGFLQFVGKLYNQVSADDIRFYLAKRVVRDKVAKTTANNERRNLSAFYTWLQKEEILLKNPMSKIDPIKATKIKKKAFSLMDLEQIRRACSTNRERAIVETLASTWCRVSELVEIRIQDIHDGKCTVHGKGDKYRDVYLNARAQLAIQSYLTERKDSNPYLFPSSKSLFGDKSKYGSKCKSPKGDWYMYPELVSESGYMDKGAVESLCRKLGRHAGVDNVHPHRFRRTGATLALRSGMPIMLVSKLLGHESIETTQIYLDISDSELEAAHRKYVI